MWRDTLNGRSKFQVSALMLGASRCRKCIILGNATRQGGRCWPSRCGQNKFVQGAERDR